ncbi:LOW QUALITY PROTEIN: olfactory receptor 2B2-like [Tachyglossus aculeatus]|uniref:LOW QUALITY PROTEIN: olfactory receptor 2B2-like n=1 Tax=Tachyglossus aculeatus TaxID=9261 RepID=UPI0018F3E3C8|nr:LOW QUALITY PROTEIN: olfactory receptor 2B2-like [Tachyglossus aculeatus]
MDLANGSSSQNFILLGFSDKPWLELPLFVIFLVSYILIILGNLTIILLCWMNSRLHTPMYFFFTNLSFLDLCYTTTTTTVPQMLVKLRSTHRAISYGGRVAQLFIFLALGSNECILLMAMSSDRFVANCQPQHYSTIMHHRLCFQLVAISWFSGVSTSVLQSTWMLKMPCCGCHRVNHFFCEVPAMLKLSRVNTVANESELFFNSFLFLLILMTLISYCFIVRSVLRIPLVKGRHWAFEPCVSHLLVVLLFFGTSNYMYLQPLSPISLESGKMISLFYGINTSMLNPIIYSLKNKDVHRSFLGLVSKVPSLKV